MQRDAGAHWAARQERPPDKHNYHYGRPTPAHGIEIARKWARGDDVEPPADAPLSEIV